MCLFFLLAKWWNPPLQHLDEQHLHEQHHFSNPLCMCIGIYYVGFREARDS